MPSEEANPRQGYPPILLYHKVDWRAELGGTWTMPSQFEAQMRWLRASGFKVVPLEGLLASGPSSQSLAITFDDGYENIYHYAYPILRQMGFPATAFLIADYMGKENLWDVTLGRTFKHLNWPQVEEMDSHGFSFGSHSFSHPDLTRISPEEVRHELLSSKERLEERLGKEVRFLSYPFGRYNRRIQDLAREAGYDACFCSYPRRGNSGFDRYAIGRRGVYIIDTLLDFKAKARSPHTLLFKLEEMKGRTINFFSRGTPIAKRMRGDT